MFLGGLPVSGKDASGSPPRVKRRTPEERGESEFAAWLAGWTLAGTSLPAESAEPQRGADMPGSFPGHQPARGPITFERSAGTAGGDARPWRAGAVVQRTLLLPGQSPLFNPRPRAVQAQQEPAERQPGLVVQQANTPGFTAAQPRLAETQAGRVERQSGLVEQHERQLGFVASQSAAAGMQPVFPAPPLRAAVRRAGVVSPLMGAPGVQRPLSLTEGQGNHQPSSPDAKGLGQPDQVQVNAGPPQPAISADLLRSVTHTLPRATPTAADLPSAADARSPAASGQGVTAAGGRPGQVAGHGPVHSALLPEVPPLGESKRSSGSEDQAGDTSAGLQTAAERGVSVPFGPSQPSQGGDLVPVPAGLPATEAVPAWTTVLLQQVRAGPDHLQVQVSPAGMGSVTVSVRRLADGVQITLVAQQADTAQWLGGISDQLAEAIRAAGVAVTGFNVVAGGSSGGDTDQDAGRDQRSPPSWSRRIHGPVRSAAVLPARVASLAGRPGVQV
ncbi:MAG: flagellar hook-length control protein FliK [Alicyclobacillus sp.]|nr:flagellar hook-length control protein FliK [Alicyclobacillus sp.]